MGKTKFMPNNDKKGNEVFFSGKINWGNEQRIKIKQEIT